MSRNKLASNPKRIWLEPRCAVNVDRCWSEHDLGKCEECGLPCIEYVRADLVRGDNGELGEPDGHR